MGNLIDHPTTLGMFHIAYRAGGQGIVALAEGRDRT
jgi:hypothetical protein